MNKINNLKDIKDALHIKRVDLILKKQSKQIEINRINEMIKVIDEIIKDGEDKT